MRLNPFVIDGLVIDPPLVLAPIADVTDSPFRRICKRYPVGLVYSEMISSQSLVRKNKKTLDMTRFYGDEVPIALQIMGADPNVMADAARILQDLGANMVDINMGCPQPKVIKANSGAALLKDLNLAASIIRAVRKAITIPLSIKIRLGWDWDNLVHTQLAYIAQEEGVNLITIHARTRSQFFSGKAKWDEIKRAKERVKIPIIANGDVVSGETAVQCIIESCGDGLMIGRGALGSPWIFKEVYDHLTGIPKSSPSPEDIFRIILDHLALIEEFYGHPRSLYISRKHSAWYIKNYPGSAELRAKIHRAQSVDEIRELLTKFFEQVARMKG